MSTPRETSGNHYNIQCPHCQRLNHYVTHGVEVQFRTIKTFTRSCFHCGKEIYYKAEWELAVAASTEPFFESEFSRKLASDPEPAATCEEVASAVREAARPDIEAGERSREIGPTDLGTIINT